MRGLLVGGDDSVAERLRRQRWVTLARSFPDLARLRVLDLGGTTTWWERAPVRPAHVTVVNLYESGEGLPWVTALAGDALEAPSLLRGEHFDVVISNSLMEHLGGHVPRKEFARVVHGMANRFWVQTPYRYFPIEPHWLFPGFQFTPTRVRSWLAPRWRLGHTHGWSQTAARDEVMSTDLLSATELRAYFPDATLIWERVLGVPKSMVAFKG